MKNNSFLDTSFLFLMKDPNDPDIYFFYHIMEFSKETTLSHVVIQRARPSFVHYVPHA